MAQHDALYLLIKSLTGSEKRYFKLRTGKQTGHNEYVKLFDAIDKQNDFDEEKIKRTLKKEINPARFAGIKNYLFEIILDSLANFSTYNTPKYKLSILLQKIEMIKNKGLLVIGKDYIAKANAISSSFEMFNELIILNRIEYKASWKATENTSVHALLDEKLGDLSQKQHNLLLFEKLYRQFYTIAYVKQEKDKEKINSFFKNPLLNREEEALSFKAKTKFYQIYAIKASIEGDKQQTYLIMLKLLQNFEVSRGDEVESNPLEYAVLINNFLIAAIDANIYTNCETYLEKLQTLKTLKIQSDERNTLEYTYSANALSYYCKILDFGNAIKCIQKIDKDDLEKNSFIKESLRESVCIYIFRIFFILGDFKKALSYLNILINKRKRIYKDYYFLSRLLYLIANYELNNIDLLDSEIFSIERILKKENNNGMQFELIFIKYFKQINSAADKQEQQEIWETLKHRLLELSEKPELQKLNYFEFIPWIESKIQNKPLRVIMETL